MRRLLLSILALLTLCYPLAVYFGLKLGGQQRLALILLLLFGVQFLLRGASAGPLRLARTLSFVVGAILALTTLLANTTAAIQLYPVAINILMLCVFAQSLFRGMPLIEQVARLQDPDLPAQGVRYTRRVTQVWCGFFTLNGAVALYTVWLADLELWTLYNGLIAYLLMGLLLAGEFMYRHFVLLKANDQRS